MWVFSYPSWGLTKLILSYSPSPWKNELCSTVTQYVRQREAPRTTLKVLIVPPMFGLKMYTDHPNLDQTETTTILECSGLFWTDDSLNLANLSRVYEAQSASGGLCHIHEVGWSEHQTVQYGHIRFRLRLWRRPDTSKFHTGPVVFWGTLNLSVFCTILGRLGMPSLKKTTLFNENYKHTISSKLWLIFFM